MGETETGLQQVQPGSGSGEGFLAWFEYLIRRKEMPEATASALRTASRRVLEVEDDPRALDVMALDVDDLLRRFRNAAKGAISQSSVDEYERRFRMSVDSYRRWVRDEPDWLPRTRRSAGSPARRGTARATGAPEVVAEREEDPPAHGMVVYPFPVRPGVQARLTLPDDLTPQEAARIAAFLDALALPDRAAAAPGSAAE